MGVGQRAGSFTHLPPLLLLPPLAGRRSWAGIEREEEERVRGGVGCIWEPDIAAPLLALGEEADGAPEASGDVMQSPLFAWGTLLPVPHLLCLDLVRQNNVCFPDVALALNCMQ